MKHKNHEHTESEEMYLKTIYQVMHQKGAARSKDISQAMGVSSSSVTGALRHLKEMGLINYEPYDVITLTDQGEPVATEIMRRYDSLSDFFINVLKVDEDEAKDCACRLEHVISSPVLNRIAKFAEFVRQCPRAKTDFMDEFANHVKCDHEDECRKSHDGGLPCDA